MPPTTFSVSTYRPPAYREVGLRIRRLRESAHYTKNALAARAGISPRALDYIEHGDREPRAGTLFAIASALNVSPVYIWTGQGA